MVTLKLTDRRPTGEVTVTITDGPDSDVTDVEEYTIREVNLESDLADQGMKLGTRIGTDHWILLEKD